jgi:hypothetical protein
MMRHTAAVVQGTSKADAQTRAAVQQQVRDAMQAAKDAQRQATADYNQAAQAMKDAQCGLVVQPPTPPVPPTIVFGVPRQGGVGGTSSGSHDPFGGGANDIPPQVVPMLGIIGVTLVFCVVGFPLARAIARWIDRRGVAPTVPREVTARLEAIEQAVESIAIEVERISEGQRFATKLLTERTHEPARDFIAAQREAQHDAVALASSPANARRS